MRVGVLVIGLLTFLGLACAAAWFVRDHPQHTVQPPVPSIDETELVIAKTGPQPRAVIERSQFDFGAREMNDEGTIEFEIRNEGDAPLKVLVGSTNARCAISGLDQNPIRPGGAAMAKLHWLPANEAEFPQKTLEIRTNDPENQKIVLTIVGRVVPPVRVLPERMWNLGSLAGDGPTEMTVTIASQLAERFTITSIEVENPSVSVTPEAITDPNEFPGPGVLSAYRLTISADPVGPVGFFIVPVRVQTDLKTNKSDEPIAIEGRVIGQRRGPYRIRGSEWDESHSAVGLGQFDSKLGKTVTLSLMAKDEPADGLQFTEITCDPEFMKVKLEPDEKDQRTPRRYHLTIEYPPGMPRALRDDTNPGRIRIKANHATAPEVEILVFFSTF